MFSLFIEALDVLKVPHFKANVGRIFAQACVYQESSGAWCSAGRGRRRKALDFKFAVVGV